MPPTDDPARPASRGAGFDEHALGLLVVRLVLGVVFIGHGGQKLFGAFGGPGLSGTAAFFKSAGYSPGKPFAVLSGLVEFGGGILLVLGLGASAAAAAIVADMAGASAVVADGSNGEFFAAKGGFELELVLAVVALGVALIGAGALALDHGRAWDRPVIRRWLAGVGALAGICAVLAR